LRQLRSRQVALLGSLLGSLAAIGCTGTRSYPHPVDLDRLVRSAPVEERLRFAPLPAGELPTPVPDAPEQYRIGPGDVLNVQGLGEEFKGFGETRRGDIVGTKVKADGRLYLPILGAVEAGGRTVLEVQEALREGLTKFKREPFVSVDVLEYRSQKYFILGEVGEPGLAPVDGETTVLEALAHSGGFDQQADVENAYVMRDQRVLPISLADLVRRGDMRQNLVLRHRDLIFVPSLKVKRVFVFGEVGSPGVFPMEPEGMTLTEALARAGGLNPSSADVNQVRIFRGGWGNPQCFRISACEVYQYGESIHLFPGDRVFIAPSTLASYTRALALVSPLLTTPLSLATTALAVDATVNR
jgi:polysaccharide export outer membrane protein